MSVVQAPPARLWHHFEALCAVPRCSGDLGAVRAAVTGWIRAWGLDVAEDAAGNLIVRKPAGPGGARLPAAALQAHLDMVCEKEPRSAHDFSCDPLDLEVADGWLHARGTTLGADNGLGVAAILAVLEDSTLVHGPLEAVFTADEETTMAGAEGLDLASLGARRWLNLDGGEGVFVIGSAGGLSFEATGGLAHTPADAEAGWAVEVRGLAGGHSGIDVAGQPGNALKLAARVLADFLAAQPSGSWQLASLDGGGADNVIPSQARGVLAGPPDGALALVEAMRRARDTLAGELGPQGEGLVLQVTSVPRPDRVLGPDAQQTLLHLILALADGVQTYSKQVPGLVETSCNLAQISCDGEGQVRVVMSVRSSLDSQRDDLARRLTSTFRLAGFTARAWAPYPAWSARAASPLRDAALRLWQDQTGQSARLEIIHAGLECGFLAAGLPGADILSFGPRIVDLHSPQERVELASVDRFYRLLTALLEAP